MKLLVTRVSNAQVTIDSHITAQISAGLLVLVGFGVGDNPNIVDRLTRKLLHLRIMPDSNQKFNLSVLDTQGEILVVSQFTLYAHLKGHRPSFTDSLDPVSAEKLYHYFIRQLQQSNLTIKSGVFAAHMDVTSTNSGPVTIIMEQNHD